MGSRRRRISTSPATTPPAKPPNQLMPPRDSSRSAIGASPACSVTHNSFAPASPPITPANPASMRAGRQTGAAELALEQPQPDDGADRDEHAEAGDLERADPKQDGIDISSSLR